MFNRNSSENGNEANKKNSNKHEYFSDIPIVFAPHETNDLSQIQNLFYEKEAAKKKSEETCEADCECTDEYDSDDVVKGQSPVGTFNRPATNLKKFQRKISKIFKTTQNSANNNNDTSKQERKSNALNDELIYYDIEYGNVANKYDPNSSLTSIKKHELKLDETITTSANSLEILFPFLRQPSNEFGQFSFSKNVLNINELNLIRKSSLISLIERNRCNNISCPFDEIVYKRFFLDNYQKHRQKFSTKSDSTTAQTRDENEFLVKNERFFIENIKSFKLNVFDLTQIKLADFMPNCIGMLLMQFFFDIFQPSELKKYAPKTLDIILELKNSYKPKLYVDEVLLTAYLTENVLWNCFALFNFRFEKIYLIGFLNYFTSLYSAAEYLENSSEPSASSEIRRVAPYFAQALVLNGLFDNDDLKLLKNYYLKIIESNLSPDKSLFSLCLTKTAVKTKVCEQPCTSRSQQKQRSLGYIEESILALEKVVDSFKPMKLKNICRIKVKQNLREFNMKIGVSLNLNESLTNFLFFNNEFEQIYNEIKIR